MADIDKQYLAYIKNTAAKLASGYSVPNTPRKWKVLRETIRSRVIESIGLPQVDRCELLPRDLGAIEADGYTLTKVSFQTIAGVWMTGNLYKPDVKARSLLFCAYTAIGKGQSRTLLYKRDALDWQSWGSWH